MAAKTLLAALALLAALTAAAVAAPRDDDVVVVDPPRDSEEVVVVDDPDSSDDSSSDSSSGSDEDEDGGRRWRWPLDEPECPMHRLGHINSLLGVTSSNPGQRVELVPDLATALTFHQGCSVRDGLTARRIMRHVKLRLYYGLGEDDNVAAPVGHASSLQQDPHFNHSRCIAVYAFGFTSDPNNVYTRDAITAMVAANRYNTLLVDWSVAANFSYELSVDLIDHVAKAVARDLKAMLDDGATLCFVSGHSLGGQMTSFISRHLRALGNPVPCAIALDPAAPLFEGRLLGCARHLARGDAEWIIVLHSDICGLGSLISHGDVDFYPNSGYHGQPGCPNDTYDTYGTPVGTCSHVRAVSIFAAALRNEGAFPGLQCDSWEDFNAGECNDAQILHFPRCDQRIPGSYFMNTTGSDPLQSTNPPAG